MNLNDLLDGLGRTSAQAALLVILVLMAQRIFRQWLPPRWRCALWILPALRLLLPVSVSSALSVFNFVPDWGTPAGIPSPLPRATDTAPILAVQAAPVTVPLSAMPESLDNDNPDPTPLAAPEKNSESLLPAPARAAAEAQQGEPLLGRPLPWNRIIFGFWLTGVALLLANVVLTSIRLSRQFLISSVVADEEVLALLEGCREELQISTNVHLVESDRVASPLLYGFRHPRLILPKDLTVQLTWDELRFVFLHELAHVKRRDILQNWVGTLLQIAHWFNPLVWLAFARWRADRELACDALALETAGPEKKQAYGRTILRLLEASPRVLAAPAMVGILEDKRQLRERISMIAAFVPGRRWSAAAVLLLTALSLAGLTDARRVVTAAANTLLGSEPQGTLPILEPPSLEKVQATNGPTMKITVADEAGRPIEGAEVRAPSYGAFFGGKSMALPWRTDASGHAEIRLGEPPAQTTQQNTWFTISVKHRDFTPAGLSWSVEKGDARNVMPPEAKVVLKKGVQLGGIAQDERGQPLSGVRVALTGTAYSYAMANQKRYQEYSEYSSDSRYEPAAITDQRGRWVAMNIPKDLENIVITMMRPDGSIYNFSTTTPENPFNQPRGEMVNIGKMRDLTETFILKDGVTVRGLVLDSADKPVPNLLMKEVLQRYNPANTLQFRTDSQGRFELRNRQRRQFLLLALPESSPVASHVVDLTKREEIVIRLTNAAPMRITVLDDKDQPLAQAKIAVDSYRSPRFPLEMDLITDGKGVAIWTNAPIGEVVLRVSSPDGVTYRKVRVANVVNVANGQREIKVRLRPGMESEAFIEGKAVDAETGEPVKLSTARLKTDDFGAMPSPVEIENSSFRIPVKSSDFRQGMYPSYKVTFEAPGYVAFTSDSHDFDEGDIEMLVKMKRGGAPGGTILLRDGTTAAAAEIIVAARENEFLFMNMPRKVWRNERAIKATADENGRFQFKDPGVDGMVLITHDGGFLESSVSKLLDRPTLTLQPWGRVEGVLKIGARTVANASVNLSGQVYTGRGGWNFILSGQTDSEGKFNFEGVPPGEHRLYRYFDRVPGPITETYQMPIVVKPGETTEVTYGGSGRTVIGQVEGDADWKNDVHLLVRKDTAPATPPNHEDYFDPEEFQKVWSEYMRTGQAAERRNQRSYWLNFNPDGSFRIEDVPSGTYELRIRVTEPLKPGERRFGPVSPDKEIASLTKEIVIPGNSENSSSEPYDLGVLELNWRGEKSTQPAVQLTAENLDGEPFSLESTRGKFVLLNFWASWSNNSEEQMAEITGLEAKFKSDQRVMFVAVNLGESATRVRQRVTANGYTMPQVLLRGVNLARVTENLKLDSLPAAFLLNPKGQVVARDLKADNVERALQSALKRYAKE